VQTQCLEGAEGFQRGQVVKLVLWKTEVPNFIRYNLRKYEVFRCQHELKPEILKL